MMTTSILNNFKDSLAGNSLAESGEILAQVAAQLGWSRVAFNADTTSTELAQDENGDYLAETMGWSAESLEEWEERRMALSCPVAQVCRSRSAPFFWDTTGVSTWFRDVMPARERKTLQYLRSFTSAGVTVPIHRAGGRTGYITWMSDSEAGARHFYQRDGDLLLLMSHHFFQRYEELAAKPRYLPPQDQAPRLTVRELECLTWAGRGKTEEEIALIIGRSKNTCRFHLRNATAKLDASNRTHAVAKACSLRMISV